VPVSEMVDRIKSAVAARTDPDFVIMARTDALANEGMDGVLSRVDAYLEAGADMIFPEAFTELEQYETLGKAIGDVPYLANITEFGKTKLFSQQELGDAGVSMVLYPLSAHRAMAKAAATVYQSILDNGHQREVTDLMQTRDELYNYLDYHKFEDTLDTLFDSSDDKAKKD
jgi:methylisocitrate lyase